MTLFGGFPGNRCSVNQNVLTGVVAVNEYVVFLDVETLYGSEEYLIHRRSQLLVSLGQLHLQHLHLLLKPLVLYLEPGDLGEVIHLV